MSDIFDPKGVKPEWELVYGLISEPESGTVVTYAQLSSALDRDFLKDRGPLDKARKMLERDNNRSLRNVRNVGYEIIDGDRQVTQAADRGKRARRQVRKGLHTSRNADRNLMSQEGIDRAARIERRMEFAEERLTRVEAKVKRTEVRVEAHDDRISALETFRKHDQDTITDRVRRLEEQLAQSRQIS